VPPPGGERAPWEDEFEFEFEDEEPGTLLREIRVGAGALAWGCILVVAVTALGAYGWALRSGVATLPDASLGFPLEVTWSLLGVLATFGGVPRQAVLAAMERDGRIEVGFTLEGRIDDPAFSINDNLATKLAGGLAETLGVSLGGVVEGVGGVIKGLLGR